MSKVVIISIQLFLCYQARKRRGIYNKLVNVIHSCLNAAVLDLTEKYIENKARKKRKKNVLSLFAHEEAVLIIKIKNNRLRRRPWHHNAQGQGLFVSNLG